MSKYFFDSYALVELCKGNPKFTRFENEEVIITVFNLAELIYAIIRDFGDQKADIICSRFSECVVEIDPIFLKEAMLFRYINRKKDLSYADCVGYILAKRMAIRFLTGDEQFKSMDNVEFIKA